jgi:hypothetical protein
MTPQLKLFEENDQPMNPLPLQIAAQYGFSLQYHQQSDDVILYNIQDWIAGVAQSNDPQRAKNIYQQIKKRTGSLRGKLSKLPYVATDGKSYRMDFADDVILYSITQAMGTNTGIRNDVLDFLAKAGAFVDELRQDPEAAQQKIANYRQSRALKAGKSNTWVNARETGVMTRNELTALLTAVCPDMNIGEATNIAYKGTLGHTAKGLRDILGIGPKQNPRDHLGEIALIYTMASEAAVRSQLSQYAGGDIVPAHVVRNVIAVIATATGKQAQDMAHLIGIDLVTGKPLLSSGAAS